MLLLCQLATNTSLPSGVTFITFGVEPTGTKGISTLSESPALLFLTVAFWALVLKQTTLLSVWGE